MFKKIDRLVFPLCIFGILFCSIVSLDAHLGWIDHFWTNQFLKGTQAEVTCNINEGKIFTKTTYYFSDGSVERSYWTPDKKIPEITIKSTAHGIGWSQIRFHGKIVGKSVGNIRDYDEAQRVGFWLTPPVPSWYAHDKQVSKTLIGQFKTAKGTYLWEGSGTIKYTPIYWKVRVGVSGKALQVSGTWDEGEVWTTSVPANDAEGPEKGTWEVKHINKYLTWPNPNGSSSTTITTM